MAEDIDGIIAAPVSQLERHSATSVARESGLSRAGIYKALAANGCSCLGRIERLADALWYRLVLEANDGRP